jgi:hypothetical protein
MSRGLRARVPLRFGLNFVRVAGYLCALAASMTLACSGGGGPDPQPTLDPHASQWPSEEECKDATPTFREVRTVEASGLPFNYTMAFVPENPAEPIELPPFRLLPLGYDGPLAESPSGIGQRVYSETEDAKLLQASRAWVAIAYDPIGYQLVQGPSGTTLDEEVAHVARIFNSETQGGFGVIWVTRVDLRVKPELPVVLRVPPCDASMVIERTTFRGHPAMIERHRFSAPNKLTFVSDDIVTEISGDTTVEELIRIAESFDPPIAAASQSQ